MTYKIGTPEYRRQYYQANREIILARSAARYAAKRDEIRAAAKVAYGDDANYARYMLDRCRGRSRAKGLECTITVSDIQIPDVCPILGMPLKRNKGAGRAAPDSPSVDRIDPLRGYVPGNVQVVSYKANAMKSNATPDELVRFAEWVTEIYGKR